MCLLFSFCFILFCSFTLNCISELIVSMLAFDAGDWGWFTVGSNQRIKIGVCCFTSKNVSSRVSIIYPKWVTCLPANCYFSVLALYKFGSACPSKTEFISIASNIACSCHDIPEKLLTSRNNYQSKLLVLYFVLFLLFVFACFFVVFFCFFTFYCRWIFNYQGVGG